MQLQSFFSNLRTPSTLALGLCMLGAIACPSGEDTSGTDAGISDAGDPQDGGGPSLRCQDPVHPACEDTMFLEMNFQSTRASEGIVSSSDGLGGFQSMVDATAGGFMPASPESFVYARFTETGLEKLPLSDDEATLSMDWDIAFHRYVVRLNGGDSGPSCVAAARLPETTLFADLSEVPPSTSYEVENYYDDSCVMIDDGYGLSTSPGTLLSPFYSYLSCVAMTGQVFLIQLRDGRVVKFEVESYYSLDKQAACDSAGTTPAPPTGSGHLGIHWAFLP